MKKLILSLLVVSLLLPEFAAGQNTGRGKPTPLKAVRVFGKVSEDGKNLIGKRGESWLVENSGALAGHEGQQVKVKCRISTGAGDIHVLSVKAVAAQARYAVNLGDSAFRR